MPRVIPVIDVMGGTVVRAVGGRREQYRPVVSRLIGSTDPGTVAGCLLAASGGQELYVADLDAIRGDESVSPAVRELISTCQVPVWLDVGVRLFKQLSELHPVAQVRPILASETCPSADLIRETLVRFGSERVAVSIDLRQGELIGDCRVWELPNARDALGLARRVAGLGIQTLIVLDLARVGTGRGSGTVPQLRAIRAEFPGVELIAGGGVKTWVDVDALGEAGADAVLVASAIHDGSLTFPRPVA